jgi:flagellar basal-body rod modification protein FlgD
VPRSFFQDKFTPSDFSSNLFAADEWIRHMTTQPINATPSPNQLASKNSALNASDFINMMVTQLQNQDPLNPTSNSELLSQMSQIGQLQTSTQLQDTLKGLALQSSLGAAGNLIGKMVQGLDTDGSPLNGLVNSVRVENSDVFLELDSGKSLKLGSVTSIAPAPATATKAAA